MVENSGYARLLPSGVSDSLLSNRKQPFKLFLEAAELYSKIRTGDTKTKLGNLPEMHLLWFFQRVIRACFEYEFFPQIDHYNATQD